MKKPFILTSWDDGTIFDMRMADLLYKYNIPGIFYIPSNTMLSDEQIKNISDFHGIGGHTVNHPDDMKKLSYEDQFAEIKNNKDWLEGVIGRRANGFCYPKGKGDETTIKAIKKAGYREARRVGWGNKEFPKDMFNIVPTAFAHPDKTKFGGKSWYDYAMDQLNDEYFHLWGHSHEIEKYNMWHDVDQFFKVLKNHYKL